MSKICVFVGPTRLQRIPDRAHVYTPAALGSIFRATQAGYRVICLIDGHFGNVPSVWHKEILYALKRGVTVCGAASIGALRAAELHGFGMLGFGWVYRAFRRGVLQDDDEVCVVHAVPELAFAPLSEAMVNIRCSLRKMRHQGKLSGESEVRIAAALKRLHFSKRTLAEVRNAFDAEFGKNGSVKFKLYERAKVDIKSLDAEAMLNAAVSSSLAIRNHAWEFPATDHWRFQFRIQQVDIPQLCQWRPEYTMPGGS